MYVLTNRLRVVAALAMSCRAWHDDTFKMTSNLPLRAAKTTEIDMLLLGKTGSGKSSTGNSILGRKIFKASNSSTSVTTEIKSEWSQCIDDDGRHYDLKVTDGPGLEDTNIDSLQDKKRAYINITKVLSECPQGIHAFLVVVKMGNRFTNEDKKSLESLKIILGDDFLRKFGVIIVTGGDNLYGDEGDSEGNTFQDWCSEQKGELKKVMKECDNRCVLFNNRTKDEALKKKQLATLLDEVLEIMSRNNGERYTNETFKQHEESHTKLLNECGLTNVKEEFRKQLSMLQGQVRKMGDSKKDETNEAHELLQTLLRHVEHEIKDTPPLESLKRDLLGLQQLLTEAGELHETGKSCATVLKEAKKQCEKMVRAASPPSDPGWLELVLGYTEILAKTVSSVAVVGGTNTGKYIAGVSTGVGAAAVAMKDIIKFRRELEYHY